MTDTAMELVARLILDSDEYDAGLDRAIGDAEKKGNGIGSGIADGIGAGLKVAGAAITAASTAMIGFGAEAVKTGEQFDSSMAQVAATMGKSVDEIQDLRDFAQKMGSETQFSASQAADALNYMALAGYSAEQSMEMLPNVLNLAAAGNMDLATASDMVTDAQTALGIKFEDMGAVIDQMAKTASTTNTSVSQLGDAMLTIGATARNMKGGTVELSQVLGVLADNGIKASEGGTHLRNMILSLQTPTKNGTEALAKLGMTYEQMYDEAGNMRALPEIFMEMQERMEGMDQASKDAIVSGIFNKADLASVNALIGTNAERWAEVEAAINDSAGAAQAMANTQLDNLSGDLTILQSAFEGFQIAISDKLTPGLRDFVKFGSEGLSQLTVAFKENGIDGAMSEFGKLLSNLISMTVKKAPEMIRAGAKLLTALVKGILSNRKEIFNAVKEIARAITTTLGEEFPKTKKVLDNLQKAIDGVFGFIESHEGTIIAVLKGVLAGFLAYKAVSTVFDTIQTSISALRSVMALLNNEMSAAALVNPYTAIAAAIGVVIGLTATLMEMERQEAENYIKSLTTLSEENKKRLDFATEYIEKLGQVYDGNKKIIDSVNEEIKPEQELLAELNNIVDANGRVKNGYEERAEVIMTQLNEAFGTEMILQDGIIQNYDEEMAKIDQLIEKKKAEALLSANADSYAEALKDQLELYDAMSSAQKQYTDLENERANAVKALSGYEILMNQAMEKGSPKAHEYGLRMQEMQITIEECDAKMGSLKGTLDATSESYYKNQDFIEDYNKLLEASENNTDDLHKAVENLTNGIIELAPDSILEKQAENALNYLNDLLKAQENDVKISERQISEAIDSANAAVDALREAGVEGSDAYGDELRNLVDEANIWGNDLADNFSNSIESKTSTVGKAVERMANTVRSMLHFSEPDVGPLADFSSYAPDMMDLFAQGVLDNEDKVTNAVEKAFDLKDTIISTPSAIQSVTGASSGLITPNAGNNITVVLELDGEKFGKAVFNANLAESQRIGVDLGRTEVAYS